MKAEQRNAILKAGGGVAGLAALAAIVVAVNVLVGGVRMRADLTADKLYTLSEGTRSMLRKLDQNVTLKLFYSRGSPMIPSHVKSYARQVEDLLRECQRLSGGRVLLETQDPAPDSEAEKWAAEYGLAGQTVDEYGTQVYFGLVALAGDREGIIPAFDPAGAETLEYNITRLIYRVARAKKPVAGVLSSLPVLGTPRMPFGGGGQQESPAWAAFRSLQEDYEVRRLAAPLDSIADDVDVLLVVHPKDFSERTWFAVDQFVLRGGHLMLMLDPLSFFEARSAGQSPYGRPSLSSDAGTLLKAWGVGYEADQMIADRGAATELPGEGNRLEMNYSVLTLLTNHVNASDLITSRLQMLKVWYAGGFTDRTAPELEFTPLLSSSTESAPVPSSAAFGGTEQIRSSFATAASGSRLALAARLHGNFRTAFPGGRPAAAAGEEESPAAAAGPARTNGASTVVLVGDTDMVYDPFCVPSVNMLGWNHNLGFFFNAVEILSGSEDLVGLRSRAGFGRPFTRVAKLRQRAEDDLRPRLQELQRREQEIVDKISALEQQRDAGQREVLSQKLQEDYATFTQSRLEISREKRDVVRRLRRDIENLGTWLKVLNIAAVPLLVSAAGLAYGWRRRQRG